MKIDYFQIINTFTKNTQASGVAAEFINETLNTAFGSKNMAQKNVLAHQDAALTQNQDVRFNSINRIEQANLIKELLKLPSEIEELFSVLLYKKITPETLETLLKQTNQKIDTDLIRQMLEGNSKETLNKLIKLFQQAPGGTQNTEQIKEILTLLSRIIPKKEASPQEILTNLTLLYLPYLPLSEKQVLEIKLEQHKNKNQDKDESEQTALVIYITTINSGKFRVSISLNKDYSIKIEIEADCEEKKYLEEILKKINEQTKKDNIKAKTEFLILKCKEKESCENVRKKQEVIISPAKDIPPILVIMAQKIAKIILETDEKISLLQEREKMLLSG